jgi:NAD(P)-dependent dehydrogenase (short-subunit alcohol dehydrogenase family)
VQAFRDRVVVVTGASEGIGRALALALAPHSPRLVLAARDAQRLDSLAQECRSAGADALAVPTDVTDEAACRALVAAAVARHGRIDVLVNNAGATMWARFDALTSLDVFERLLRVNFLGAVYCTRHALPHLRAARGRLVAVASVAGLTGVPERTAYAASKHAMVGFFESLRIELRGSGVSVTIVAPDFVVSEIHRRAMGPDGAPLGTSPMQEGRIMSADECARLMLRAIAARERLLITSSRGRLGRWMKLVAPEIVDRVAAAAIAKKR